MTTPVMAAVTLYPFKANMPEGERSNGLRDSSFAKFRKSEKFIKALAEMRLQE